MVRADGGLRQSDLAAVSGRGRVPADTGPRWLSACTLLGTGYQLGVTVRTPHRVPQAGRPHLRHLVGRAAARSGDEPMCGGGHGASGGDRRDGAAHEVPDRSTGHRQQADDGPAQRQAFGVAAPRVLALRLPGLLSEKSKTAAIWGSSHRSVPPVKTRRDDIPAQARQAQEQRDYPMRVPIASKRR
jgi:hypothetical protein